MALKAQVEKLDGLPVDVQKEYKETEIEGKKVFVLDIEGAEDTGALKRAKEYEKKGRQDAEAKLKDASGRVEQLQNEIDEMRRGNIPKGDVEKLEKSWKDKMAAKEAELTADRDSALGTVRTLLVDNVATAMAAKLAGDHSDLILPHIKSRLTTEKTSTGYITRVLDKDGKPSASSIEELQKEFTADKRFAPIIIGSKASGGGASGGGNGSGAPAKVDPKFDWNKASPKEIAAQVRARKENAGG